MAQTGFTPILVYASGTATNVPLAANLTSSASGSELALNYADGKLYYKDSGGVVQLLASKAGASGDVVGPASATDNAVARFDLTTGKLIQNSVVTIGDTGDVAGVVALTASGAVTLSGGTANGVAYLNGSKVLTTGSALTFDGNTFTSTGNQGILSTVGGNTARIIATAGGTYFGSTTAADVVFQQNSTEGMRLTSTGLGIGTSSPGYKLHVVGTGGFANNGNENLFLIDTSGSTRSSLQISGATNYFNANIDSASHGQYVWRSSNAYTERMRLDSSGNLGLGVTPSAWATVVPAIQLGSAGAFLAAQGSSTNVRLGVNAYYNGGYIYTISGAASMYQQAAGAHSWHTAASGTAGNAISFTQAMTLDASGRLMVGTTSPISTYDKTITVVGSGSAGLTMGDGTRQYAFGVNGGALQFYDNTASAERARITSGGNFGIGQTSPQTALGFANAATISWGTTNYPFISGDQPNNTLTFGTQATERARIDSSGNLLVGTTAIPAINVKGNALQNFSNQGRLAIGATVSNADLAYFYSSTALAGAINVNGAVCTYTSFSDYRLKEDVAPMTGALAKVAALNPVTYKWKTDGSAGQGFIAHELQAVVPECVTGEKDSVDEKGNPKYQGIDTSFLVATLTAAIQELKAEFDAYKATHP